MHVHVNDVNSIVYTGIYSSFSFYIFLINLLILIIYSYYRCFTLKIDIV